MNSIRTWEELLTSDLPLRGDEVNYSSVGSHFASVRKPDDSFLRIDWGLVILSVIHSVIDPLVKIGRAHV